MDRLDCERAMHLLHLKLDGELREDDARLLAEHIEGCEHCRRLQDELERVDAALREGLKAIEAPEPAVAATRQEVHRARRARSRWYTWLPAAAAFLLVALVALLVIPGLQGPVAEAAPATVVSGGDAIHVFEPNEKTAQAGRTGTELQERSVAWGMGEEPIALAFAGGARVGLSDEAVVRIGRDTIDLFKGNLRADLTNTEKEFSVITPWGEFTCSGALFLVYTDTNGGAARVSVISGDVTVARGGRERVLSENESITLEPDPKQTIAL